VRNTFAETLYQASHDRDDVYIVVADISPAGPMATFSAEFPQRFINVGVAEQCMVGIAAGLALKGCRPFCYTIATFALYRPFEMIRDDLCYQHLPVTVVGIGGGVVYSTLGGTHYAQEDVAVASALPGMQVLAPCDPAECADATRWCVTQNAGPVYLRLGKAGEPTLTAGAEPWAFGKIRYLSRGTGMVIFTYGIIARLAVAVAERLRSRGMSVSIVSVHTLKPLDRTGIVDALKHYAHAVVIEEHGPHGGLTPQVKALAWDAGVRTRIDAFTLQDAFIHNYGSHDDLLAAHGLSAERIVEVVTGPGRADGVS
jgi:transketolase